MTFFGVIDQRAREFSERVVLDEGFRIFQHFRNFDLRITSSLSADFRKLLDRPSRFGHAVFRHAEFSKLSCVHDSFLCDNRLIPMRGFF